MGKILSGMYLRNMCGTGHPYFTRALVEGCRCAVLRRDLNLTFDLAVVILTI